MAPSSARVAIFAVEDGALTVWRRAVFLAVFERDVEWESIRRRVAEILYAREEESRARSSFSKDARARHRELISTSAVQLMTSHGASQNNQAPRAMKAATNTMTTTRTSSAELIRR